MKNLIISYFLSLLMISAVSLLLLFFFNTDKNNKSIIMNTSALEANNIEVIATVQEWEGLQEYNPRNAELILPSSLLIFD